MRWFVIPLSVLLAAASPDWPAPKMSNTSEVSAEMVSQVIGRLLVDCPAINVFRDYVEDITFETYRDPGYHNQTYGWDFVLEVGFHLSNETPAPDLLGWNGSAAGDVMLFDFGAGRRPGLVVNKPTSRLACGLPTDTTDDAFISDPWMSQLAPSIAFPNRKGASKRPL